MGSDEIAVALIVFGLALDVIGLTIISWHGLFDSDGELDRQAKPQYGMNTGLRTALGKNRTALRRGVAVMAIGFGFQAVGALIATI